MAKVNSLPVKPVYKKSEVKKAVGCLLTVGFANKPAVTGILMPESCEGQYKLLARNSKGRLGFVIFESATQVTKIDVVGQVKLLDILDPTPVLGSNEALVS